MIVYIAIGQDCSIVSVSFSAFWGIYSKDIALVENAGRFYFLMNSLILITMDKGGGHSGSAQI